MGDAGNAAALDATGYPTERQKTTTESGVLHTALVLQGTRRQVGRMRRVVALRGTWLAAIMVL